MKLTKQELSAKIWSAANEMRGSVKPEDYKDFILGLMFYKFLSEKELQVIAEDEGYETEQMPEEEIKEYLDNEEAKSFIVNTVGYCINYNDLFSSEFSVIPVYTVISKRRIRVCCCTIISYLSPVGLTMTPMYVLGCAIQFG